MNFSFVAKYIERKMNKKVRFSPKRLHHSMTPRMRQRTLEKKSHNMKFHMLCSSYSSGSEEVSKNQRVEVEEVSGASIFQQGQQP